MAEKLGLTRQSVSKWEAGQVLPEAETLMRVSEIFDVSTDYLLKGVQNGTPPPPLPVQWQEKGGIANHKSGRSSAAKIIIVLVCIVLGMVLLAVAAVVLFGFNTHSVIEGSSQQVVWQAVAPPLG